MTLQLDYSLALTERTPGCGLDLPSLRELAPRVDEAVTALSERDDLGFFRLPTERDVLAEINAFVDEQAHIKEILVLGIGGSSLGGQTILNAVAPQDARPVHFLDNSDPTRLARILKTLDPATTLAIVMSKSGGTIETAAQFLIVHEWLGARASTNLVAVTDPDNGILRAFAKSAQLRTFPIPSDVGGRFSVLTAVGLLPARLAGVDAEAMLRGATEMAERCRRPLFENPAALFAAIHYLHDRDHGRRIHVLMPYSDPLRALANWFVQLWAESLGKRTSRTGEVIESGPTPLPAVGATDQHAQVQLFMEGPRDKLVTFVATEAPAHDLVIPKTTVPGYEYLSGHSLFEILDAEQRGTAVALSRDGRPSLLLKLPTLGAFELGELFFLFEAATAISGELYDIDAFNQPGVEAGKNLAYGLLGRDGYQHVGDDVRQEEASGSRHIC